MRILPLLVLALLSGPVAAERYRSTTLAPDRATLVLHTVHGDVRAPRTDPGQQGFDAPHVAADGRTVGWLVLEGNCCTSYPLPTSLVLYRDGKLLHRFADGMAIWAWGFARDGRAVAYRQRAPHGVSTIVYTLRDTDSGRKLAEFDCYPRDDTPAGQPVPYVHDDPVPGSAGSGPSPTSARPVSTAPIRGRPMRRGRHAPQGTECPLLAVQIAYQSSASSETFSAAMASRRPSMRPVPVIG
jgi:hypothetical protein